MLVTKEVIFKPKIFSKEHKLVFNQNFIELHQLGNDSNPVKFTKLEFDQFRFGVKWIRGYRMIFGRINCIDIKSSTGVIMKIRLVSIYKINLKKINKKYSEMLNGILEYYVSDIVGQYLKLFNYKQPFSILDVHFSQQGIQLNDKYKIEWNNVDVKSYYSYVAISTKSKTDIYRGFDHLEEWNALVLYNVVRLILKSKNLLND